MQYRKLYAYFDELVGWSIEKMEGLFDMTFGELKWDAFSSSQKTGRITNDNNAIEEWTFDKGGTCYTRVNHFGPQFTFHRKSRFEGDSVK